LPASHFFYKHPATTEIYTLSLHDALPISWQARQSANDQRRAAATSLLQDYMRLAIEHPDLAKERDSVVSDDRYEWFAAHAYFSADRKSTRLNSSHLGISYAVFCLKKKTNN